jgi:hypothetical protein
MEHLISNSMWDYELALYRDEKMKLKIVSHHDPLSVSRAKPVEG